MTGALFPVPSGLVRLGSVRCGAVRCGVRRSCVRGHGIPDEAPLSLVPFFVALFVLLVPAAERPGWATACVLGAVGGWVVR